VVGDEKSAWWPRLTAKPEKLTWLKIDFSRWKDPDISSSDDEAKNPGKTPPGFDMEAYEVQNSEIFGLQCFKVDTK